MKNSMAKAMAERYADYFKTNELEERAARSLYYWAMSTIESIFWGSGRKAESWFHIYVSETKIFLLFQHPRGEIQNITYNSTFNCSNGKLQKIVERFVKIFNSQDTSFSEGNIASIFKASYCKDEKDKEKYTINIYVDMLPNSNSETENHGRH